MYRVELKVAIPSLRYVGKRSPVPNVPCGVESIFNKSIVFPNSRFSFLMYRVELKAPNARGISNSTPVPNVPCGVESGL